MIENKRLIEFSAYFPLCQQLNAPFNWVFDGFDVCGLQPHGDFAILCLFFKLCVLSFLCVWAML